MHMNIFSVIKVFIVKKPYVAIFIVLAMAGAGWYIYVKNEGVAADYDITIAARGDVIQKVSVTGKVKAKSTVDLAFERGGRVANTSVSIGDMVAKGQTLARLDNADVYANLLRAKAIRDVEAAKLADIENGTRPEELAIAQTQADSSQIALLNAEQDVRNKIIDAFTKADDAIHNRTNQFFSNPDTSNPQFNFNGVDSQLKVDLETDRARLNGLLSAWGATLLLLASTDIDDALNVADEHLRDETRVFVENVARAINSLVSSSGLSQTTIDLYKTDTATARTNVNAAIINLTAAKSGLSTARANLRIAEQELALKQAGATKETLDAEKAALRSADADVANYQAQLGKTIIAAPFTGVITRTDIHPGEIVSPNAPLISLMSIARYEIESYVAEADIAKIKIGNTVAFTLDAYGEDRHFDGEVISIDPAETVREGVSTYRIILQFIDSTGDVRSGMTANADIFAANRTNVIFVPARAIIDADGQKFLQILFPDGTVEKRQVVVGLRGSAGTAEITEGLSEGETVIVFTR